MREILGLAFALSACSHSPQSGLKPLYTDKPPAGLVQKLEARLEKEPCVGSLDRWSRRYSYSAPHGKLNNTSVVIQFAEAGHRGRAAGLYVDTPPAYVDLATGKTVIKIDIDNSQFRSAFGLYDIRRSVINSWHCGPNISSMPIKWRTIRMDA